MHRLIDSVFIANIGTGSGPMVLAGITVHKQVIGYKSDSGKSTGWRLRLTGQDRMVSPGIPRRSRRRPTIDATTLIETGACMNDGATKCQWSRLALLVAMDGSLQRGVIDCADGTF